jgi:hypothetical protein
VSPLILYVADVLVRTLPFVRAIVAGRRLLLIDQVRRVAPGYLVVVVLVLARRRRSLRAATALGVRAAVRRHHPMGTPHVSVHIAVRRERHIAVLAFERSLTRVYQHVPVQRARRAEHLIAYAAAVILLAAAVRAAR